MNLQDFFHMGGYAFYVWSAYGIALLVLLANLLSPLRLRRRLIAELARRAEGARRST